MTFFSLKQGQDLGGTLSTKIPGNTPPPPLAPSSVGISNRTSLKSIPQLQKIFYPGDYSEVTYVILVNAYGNLINHECTEQVYSDININPHILSIKVTGVCLAFNLNSPKRLTTYLRKG